MNEVWKSINGYDGLYEVSNFGRVRSVDRVSDHHGYGMQFHKGKILKQHISNKYHVVALSNGGNVKTHLVHRLVAQAFVENPNNYTIVNHIDEHPNNNKADNLEWCTQKHNVNHGTGIARRSLTQSKPIIATLEDGTKETYSGVNEAGRTLGCSCGNICSALKGIRKKAGGRTWEYAEVNMA